MCCLLCLQAEGEKKAEAVATVVAAVDLARVLQPVTLEEEEEATVHVETKQQAATEKQVVLAKIAPAEAAAEASGQHRAVVLSQVGRVYRVNLLLRQFLC